MKFSHIKQIVDFLAGFSHIIAAFRVDDTTIKIVFDRENSINFALKPNNYAIYLSDESSRAKIYQAPFDITLAKRLNRSKIEQVTMHNSDKIIRIYTKISGSYKSESTIVQIEFLGSHANAIILDENEQILEALRHIDSTTRAIRVGYPLRDAPKPQFSPKDYPIDNIREFLESENKRVNGTNLDRLKKDRLKLLQKRLNTLKKYLNSLDSHDELLKESAHLNHTAQIVLANLDQINPYDKEVILDDFNGEQIKITLPQISSNNPSAIAEYFFKRAKKAKQKAIGLEIERDNLLEKIKFNELFIKRVEASDNAEDIALLFPPREKKRSLESNDMIEEFFIDGFKISLGKNAKANELLLQRAKAKDIWMHLKDIPSAHIIISTDKQQLPQKILDFGAKLCVDFSTFEKGSYLVDYTTRREVRAIEGSNVLYNNYKTIKITKD